MSRAQRIVMLFGVLSITAGALGLYFTSTQSEHFLKNVWGGCGPCLTMNNDCGTGHSMGTCHFDESLGYCTPGQYGCSSGCPSGGSDQYCSAWAWNCGIQMVHCSRMRTYTCLTEAGSCSCDESGVGIWCWRQTCN